MPVNWVKVPGGRYPKDWRGFGFWNIGNSLRMDCSKLLVSDFETKLQECQKNDKARRRFIVE